MANAFPIVVNLALAREAIHAVFNGIMRLALTQPIPCETLATYNALNLRLFHADMALVKEVRDAGLRPPEDAPRAIASIGQCLPGESETSIGKDGLEAGRRYTAEVLMRARNAEQNLVKAYQENEDFHGRADALMRAGVLAQFLPAETLNSAVALKLIYFIGGTMWPSDVAEQVLEAELSSVSLPSAERLAEDAQRFAQAFAVYLRARGGGELGKAKSLKMALTGPGELLKTTAQKLVNLPWWAWAAGFGLIGVAGYYGYERWSAGRALQPRKTADIDEERRDEE